MTDENVFTKNCSCSCTGELYLKDGLKLLSLLPRVYHDSIVEDGYFVAGVQEQRQRQTLDLERVFTGDNVEEKYILWLRIDLLHYFTGTWPR
jgi:hypothetical protein